MNLSFSKYRNNLNVAFLTDLQVDECSESCEMFVDLGDVVHVVRDSSQLQCCVWCILLLLRPRRTYSQPFKHL